MNVKFSVNLKHPCLKNSTEELLVDERSRNALIRCNFKNILDMLMNMEALYECEHCSKVTINKIKYAVFDYYIDHLSTKQYKKMIKRLEELNA